MRILSGVQSSGKPHIGNYFGAIRQFIELQHKGEGLYFIANYHALTTVRDAKLAHSLTLDVALDYLALGLDPEKAVLFRQSDIPEVIELFWYLLAITPKALLDNAVSYKDKISKGIAPEAGLFTYPVLMAADILLYGSDVVPVGKDQVQHIEITRDLATKFNLIYVPGYDPADPEGKAGGVPGILKLPQALVDENTAVVPGLDGKKMSKSYGNTVEIFGDDKTIKKKIMSIVTDSTPVEAPKDMSATPLFTLLRAFASTEDMQEIERTCREGGLGYGHYKLKLVDLFHATFDSARSKRKELESEHAYVEKVLAEGAQKARIIAEPIINQARQATGILPPIR
jgi:tryptophanyl-tRNA synthetase